MAVEQAYRASLKPLLLLAYEGDTLAGVAALATDNAEKQVSFLCGTTADYCDFICPPRAAGGVCGGGSRGTGEASCANFAAGKSAG